MAVHQSLLGIDSILYELRQLAANTQRKLSISSGRSALYPMTGNGAAGTLLQSTRHPYHGMRQLTIRIAYYSIFKHKNHCSLLNLVLQEHLPNYHVTQYEGTG